MQRIGSSRREGHSHNLAARVSLGRWVAEWSVIVGWVLDTMDKPLDAILEWRLVSDGGMGDGTDEAGAMLAGWVRRHGIARDLRRNAMVFVQGHPCRELCWLEGGWVTLLRSEGTGTELIVGFRGQGTLLGTGALTSDAVYPLTARARTSVRVWWVPPAALDDALSRESGVRRMVFGSIAAEAAEQAARCGALGCLDAREHLERLLIEFASRCGTDGPTRIPLATTEIAGLLGIDMSHACRLLRGMKQEGLIEITRGWITVPDLARFSARRAS
jgi:CRP-like cAMP-binding protein